MSAEQDDGQASLGNRDPDLIEAPAGDEGGKGCHDGAETARGQAGSDTHSVLLGDSHLNISIGESGAELHQADRIPQIRIHDDDRGILRSAFKQLLTEGVAGGFRRR
jgi:hypothetical protein